ncbi:phosphoribosylformylglycinamidine cyclo-ligase [Fervidicoccus fontis]|uniref:phosphoribosylformylglycinamidine cyclo-ligase n=1 Tax=Fervidicoccus fontis TaxID=683846 RepID=A0A7C2VN49_9CREN|nr:phosphoribosylformylglycinamidine cyclo-ligase [Fervidicoccus fontis]MBE9391166.1 phosphoribosylformylglycinamidine cyclo-ligase [Fervidicoccus fontis]PMB78158.1 MAG: phosphoribosylformylglycinamidine cyclo-ligase [Fervidicoccus fontis]HEW64034.1 phosphoribosylformylglycinamidine cyclo-ligase [Fervidicoccus fontis]
MRYKDAGVDLQKHNNIHEIAKMHVFKLSNELGSIIGGVGGYSPYMRIFGRELTLHVDGVGTKVQILSKFKKLDVAGWDCIAMNANDMACEGFRTLAFSDYIAMDSADEEGFEEIIKGMIDALRKVKAPLLSGETAIMPGIVSGKDVVCFALGSREIEFKNKAKEGDVVVGVESNGLHSNGYSLVRKVVEEKIGGYDREIEGLDLKVELTKPTFLYYNLIIESIEKDLINSAAHVTGGGWKKLKRVLGEVLDMNLSPPPPPQIFEVLLKYGEIPIEEAYSVFNMGVGLVFTTEKESLEELIELIERHSFRPVILGEVSKGSGLLKIEANKYGKNFVL